MSKYDIKKENTLQIAIYYLMDKKSGQAAFKNIDKITIYNPRLNKVYELKVADIADSMISEISKYVIGYSA